MQANLASYIQSAIRSSEIYYQYLTDHQRGMIEYDVDRIKRKDKYIILTLRSKIKNPEMIQIRIENKIYTPEEIKPIEYSEELKQLTVRPLDCLVTELSDAAPRDVTVISDLRFLVKRIENWYRNYGQHISFPNKHPDIPIPDEQSFNARSSAEQKTAIHAALSHSFSYIWGAPGTGKTQVVLAHCILAYVQAKKRIWITAPTNNAVEQMLYGLLPVLENAGIPLEKVLRMGIASHAFRSRYPMICENTTVIRILSSIENEISQIDSQLADTQKQINLLKAYKNFLSFEQAQNRWEREYPAEIQQIEHALRQLHCLKNEYIQFQGRIYLAQAEQETLESQEKKLKESICSLTDKIAHYKIGWRKWFFSSRLGKLMQSLQSEMQKLDNTQGTIKHIADSIKAYTEQQQDIQQKELICKEQFFQHKAALCELASHWMPLLRVAERLQEQSLSSDVIYLRTKTKQARNILEKRRPHYVNCSVMSSEKLMECKKQLEQQRNNCLAQKQKIEQNVSNIPIEKCLVLAATVDSFLHRMTPQGDLVPAHIFLDEAGYCSLIKGTALLAYHCPITFLGDHMQLPPVCEMTDEMIHENREPTGCLWAQSALYAENIFLQPIEQLAREYRLHVAAQFNVLKRFDLTHTYRFGEDLARVLANSVYTRDFVGNPEHSTDIYFAHAEKTSQAGKRRTNQAECDFIASYVHSHPDEQIGIITPYKNQRDAIRKTLSHINGEDDFVLTVHGSQGREWDTVLFSVVDTSDKWFTDSNRLESNGKRVVNTAVSRAKHRLILVCDANYWKFERSQLIGKLLEAATEY